MTTLMFAAAALIAMPQMASAAEQAPACTAPGVLPGELTAWATPATRIAAADATISPSTLLVVGQAASVTLVPTPSVTYPLQPEKPGGPGSFGGLLQVVVAARGTYRIALGAAAWIDLVSAGGAAVVSTAHAHGPACTGLRKMVDFVIDPGPYTLQISGSGSADSKVLIVRLP